MYALYIFLKIFKSLREHGQRKKRESQAGSAPSAQSPMQGSNPQTEIMTWTERRCLTDWAPQAPQLCIYFSYCILCFCSVGLKRRVRTTSRNICGYLIGVIQEQQIINTWDLDKVDLKQQVVARGTPKGNFLSSQDTLNLQPSPSIRRILDLHPHCSRKQMDLLTPAQWNPLNSFSSSECPNMLPSP